MKKLRNKIVMVVMALWVGFATPASVCATRSTGGVLPESELYFYSENGIYFYNQFGSGCASGSGSDNEFKGGQYNLSEDDLRGFARAALNENNCNLSAVKNELSLMANLYDANSSKYSSLVDYLHNSGWFATSTIRAFDSGGPVSEQYVQAAKDVLVNGNRTLPPEVKEHDCVGDLSWVELNGVMYYGSNAGGCRGTGLSDKSLYVSGKTKIHNVYGSTYIFYQWAGGPESTCGDPFGYFPGNAPSGNSTTPSNTNNELTESYTGTTGSNVNYAGAQVWSDSELQQIQKYKSIYAEAANKFNFPWQVLATLHSQETGLRLYNPENGQGVYQLYSYTAGGSNGNRFPPAGSITMEEFRRQTIIAAEFVSNMVGDLNNPDNVKKLFFRYNGTSSIYIDKALAMGFTREQAENGEGSAYVMNRYDAQRDPSSASMSSAWPGRYVADGVYDPTSTSMVFGAFVKYEALAGGSSAYCSDSGGGGTIAETAISLSWEGAHSHSINDPKPEYVSAMKAVNAYQVPCESDSNCTAIGASCDQFVGTVMRYSGADTSYPVFGPGVQEEHMQSHPDMYQKVETGGDLSLLQPGDIFVTNNNGRHIYIYVGQLNGSESQASASYGGRTGEHFAGVYFSDNGGARIYNVYRRTSY